MIYARLDPRFRFICPVFGNRLKSLELFGQTG
jgi:hypothetical protein